MKYWTFDIEVTNTKDHKGLPYLWVVSKDGKHYEYGRELSTFKTWLNKQDENEKVVIYVHNLTYEYQFLKGFLKFSTDHKSYLFVDPHRCVKATYRNFEFRDSCIWTAMSLDHFLKTYECEIQKLSYDYDKFRTPATPLTDEELEYCIHDTLGLWEGVKRKLKADGDTLKTTPLTSTGFVRRDIKHSLTKEQRAKFKMMNEAFRNYEMCKAAFRGGNTFANPRAIGMVYDNVICSDITSSYPTRQIHNKYPCNDFKPCKNYNGIRMEGYLYIFTVRYTNLSTKLMYDPCPPLSLSKCDIAPYTNYEDTNGRILEAECVTTTMCCVEEDIMARHYEWDKIEYLEVLIAPCDYIPYNIKDVILNYYYTKENSEGIDYKLAKAHLNSVYGMSAQDIGKDNVILQDDMSVVEEAPTHIMNNPAEPYSWGLFTAAYARDALDREIMEHVDTFLYCDTDSVFLVGEAIEKDPLVEGTKLGRWRVDKVCKKFKTLGAKRYMYIDENDEKHLVCAGVKPTVEIPDIEDFKDGIVFKEATVTSYYCDEPCEIKGYYVPSCVCIERSDYTLTQVAPNMRYLEAIQLE